MAKCRDFKAQKSPQNNCLLSFDLRIQPFFFPAMAYMLWAETCGGEIYCTINHVLVMQFKSCSINHIISTSECCCDEWFSFFFLRLSHTDFMQNTPLPLLFTEVFDDVMSTMRSAGRLPVFLMSGRCQRVEVHSRAEQHLNDQRQLTV